MFPSKIKVYTNGLVEDETGAYSYIVLECKSGGEIEIAGGRGQLFLPSILRAKFAQAGKATDDTRMKMRAVYEGLRHCPDGMEVEVYTDNFLMSNLLEITKPNEEDGDIAERYRKYIAEHHLTPQFSYTAVYNEKDFPCNDHDEWTWYAHWLCENEIKKFKRKIGYESTYQTDPC